MHKPASIQPRNKGSQRTWTAGTAPPEHPPSSLTHTAGSEGGGASGHVTWQEPSALAIPPCTTNAREPHLDIRGSQSHGALGEENANKKTFPWSVIQVRALVPGRPVPGDTFHWLQGASADTVPPLLSPHRDLASWNLPALARCTLHRAKTLAGALSSP